MRILFLTTSESKSIRTGDSEGRLGSYSRHCVLHVIQTLKFFQHQPRNCTRLYRVERGSAAKRRRERANSRESAHTHRHAQARSDRQRARVSPPMSRAHVFERVRTSFLNVCVVELDALTILKPFLRTNKHLAPSTPAHAHALSRGSAPRLYGLGLHKKCALCFTKAKKGAQGIGRALHCMSRGRAGRAWHCMITQGAHGIACREVAHRSMQFDRHIARSNVECPSGPTADAPAHQPLTNDHGAGWPLCRGQGVSGTRDTWRAAWVVRWVVGAVSVNRRRASGGYRHATPCRRRGTP